MLIESFTVFAQLINFLVLVWLLKRYLYRPVLDAIDARQKLITTQIRNAEEQQAAALAERREYEEKNDVLTQKRDALLKTATQQAEEERARLIAVARDEADALRKSFDKRRADEHAAWHRGLASRARHEVFEIVRRVLEDLADAQLEDRVIEVLSRRLQNLDAEEKSLLANSARNGNGAVTVRSSLPTSESSREKITAALQKIVGPSIIPSFQTDDSLICGIEVDLDGRRVAWNVADYLQQFELAADTPEARPARATV